MRTTIDISDALYRETRQLLAREGKTFHELIEAFLKDLLQTQKNYRKPFKWRHIPFGGKGLTPGLQEGDWGKIREMVYEGRGG